MGLVFWWLAVFWLVILLAYGAIKYYLSIRKKPEHELSLSIPVAHSDRLTGLKEYKDALKMYSRLLHAFGLLVTISLLMAVLLSARPASISFIAPAQQSRDIMLCLDVSGSVLRADSTLVNRFNALVNGFTDQRFGLTVFNSSSIDVVPLSNDYPYINEQLKKVGTALREQKGQGFTDLTSGTLADFDKGTSLVGDGVVSCINNLDGNVQNRSQSIILATDNETNGKSIIALEQAFGLAEDKGIRVYAIDPGARDAARAADHRRLQSLSEQTGGSYHLMSDKQAVDEIITDISEQEAKYVSSTPVVAITDTPRLFLYALLVSATSLLFLAWRLKI